MFRFISAAILVLAHIPLKADCSNEMSIISEFLQKNNEVLEVLAGKTRYRDPLPLIVNPKDKSELIRFSLLDSDLKICERDILDPGSIDVYKRVEVCNSEGDKIELIGEGMLSCIDRIIAIKSVNLAQRPDVRAIPPTLELRAKKIKELNLVKEKCDASVAQITEKRNMLLNLAPKEFIQNQNIYLTIFDNYLAKSRTGKVKPLTPKLIKHLALDASERLNNIKNFYDMEAFYSDLEDRCENVDLALKFANIVVKKPTDLKTEQEKDAYEWAQYLVAQFKQCGNTICPRIRRSK